MQLLRDNQASHACQVGEIVLHLVKGQLSRSISLSRPIDLPISTARPWSDLSISLARPWIPRSTVDPSLDRGSLARPWIPRSTVDPSLDRSIPRSRPSISPSRPFDHGLICRSPELDRGSLGGDPSIHGPTLSH